MLRRTARIIAMLAAAALAVGCAARAVSKVSRVLGGENEAILESDVAAPPDMENRHSSGIEQSGETLVGGRFTFRGHLEETDAFAREIVARYEERGWSVTRNQVETNHGRLSFRKGDRQVDVEFRGNPLNPWMSQATVFVRRSGYSATEASGGGQSGKAA
jgi:hypothetical protein